MIPQPSKLKLFLIAMVAIHLASASIAFAAPEDITITAVGDVMIGDVALLTAKGQNILLLSLQTSMRVAEVSQNLKLSTKKFAN